MANLLFTSNGFYTESIKNQFLKLINGETSNLKVSIITTASSQKENNRFAQKARNDFGEMGFQMIDYLDFEHENPEWLEQIDVIYLNGGNPFSLLFHMKQSGADEILRKLAKQNVIIVGVSAGAIILGPNIDIVHHFTPQLNTVNLKDFRALGLTDKVVFPHYDREDLIIDSKGKSIEERIREFEILNHCTVHRMADEGFMLIEN
jgi:dipeptidase E